MNTRFLGILVTVGLSFSAFANAGTPLDIASEDSLLVDDFADGDYTSNLGKWVFPNDNGDGGGSTVKTSIVDATTNIGPAKALKLDYTLSRKKLDYEPFVEAQVSLAGDGSAVDLSKCTEIRYEYYVGKESYMSRHFFRVIGDTNAVNVAYNYHNKTVYGGGGWQTAVIKWGDLRQASGWGEKADIGVVRKNAVAFSWQLQGEDGESGSLQIANVRCMNLPTYTVRFYRGKELLDSAEFTKGELPSYNGRYQLESEKYNYRIVGWKPAINEVKANVDYQAVLDSSIRSYDVVFYDADGYTLTRQFLEYGTVPRYVGMDPVKLPSVGYTYTFKGWGKQICEEVEKTYCYDKDEYCDTWTEYVCHVDYVKEFPPVTSSVEYFPVYDSTANSYTVKFADYDGKTLSEKRYAYGTKAKDITKPKDPSRAKAGDVEYSFEKWTPSVSDVNGDAVYVATYNAKKVENGETVPVEIYTVVFANGDSVLQIGEYDAGSMPEYKGATPTKDSTAKYVYYFLDWRDQNGWSVENIYENKVYMADFDSDYRKYWIVFLDEDGTLIDSVQYEYGQMIDAYNLKTRSYEDGYQHDYDGWEPALQRVTERAVYKAVYSAYRVLFVYDDGTWYEEHRVGKGQIPECKYCNPKKDPTKDVTYKFVGWNKEFAPVTDTVTYTAVFVAEPLPKATAVDIAVGDSWLIDDFEDGDEISLQGGTWFTYDDHDAIQDNGKPYNSQISKMVAVNGNAGNVLNILYKRECEEAYKYDKESAESSYGGFYCDGWIGVGVTLASEGNAADLSKCNAIQYDYRGGAHFFRIESIYDKNENHLEKFFAATDKWTTATIYRSEFMEGTVNADLAFAHATQLIWNNMIDEGTLELDNIKCMNKPSYTVKFYDGETLLDSAVFAQGETPVYRGEQNEWMLAYERGADDKQYEYEFDGWSPEIKPVTADAVYQIRLKKQLRRYEICFSGEGIDYDCHDEEYGKTPVYRGSLTREADKGCSKYVFDKWYSYEYHDYEYVGYKDEPIYGVQPVTGDRHYYGEFTCTEPVTFVITFLNDNGDTLSSEKYRYGEYFSYFDPSKESTVKYDYEFDGWTPYFDWDDNRVFENKTYTAQYRTSIRQYYVQFEDADGNTIYVNGDWGTEYPYGTLYSDIQKPTEEPEKYADDDVQYVFAGWSPSLSDKDSVTGDVTFVPSYKHKYAVQFENYDGSTIEVEGAEKLFYLEGTSLSNIVLPKENPTRDSTEVCNDEECKKIGYEFMGWLPTIDPKGSVTGPMTFRASYKSSVNTFTVVFMQDNEILSEVEFAEGDLAVYNGWSLYKSSTEEFTYTWDETDGWEPKLDKVTEPTVYKAKFTATRNQYEVVFETYDGTELSRKTYDYGAKITNVPTKEQLLAGIAGEYMYSGEWCRVSYWTNYSKDKDEKPVEVKERYLSCYGDFELPLVTGDVTYTPNVQYRISFVNDTDTLRNYWLSYGYDIGWLAEEIVRWEGYRVKKQSSVQYDYTWNGKWDKEVTKVTGAVTYQAAFDSTLRKYSVAFVDEDGTVLKEATTYDYGTKVNAIALPAKDPTKAATVDTTYTFAGWSLVAVTGDTTYKATYKADQRKYLVKFVAEDGKTVVESASYAYETEASAIKVPKAPAKEGFKFKSWTPEIADVTKNATYKATYIENSKFVVTWRNEDGTLLKQEVYSEGDTPKYPSSNPTKKASVDSTFTFSAWTPAIAAVTKDAEYKATYKSTVRKYKVKFANADGTMLDSAVYAYGTSAEKIKLPEVPAKASTADYVYTFAGWTPAIEDVTGAVTYTALFGNQKRTYNVSLKDGDGNVWEIRKYYYNEVVSLDWGPSKYTPECHYDFDKWVRTVGKSDTVKADMEYEAAYSSKCDVRYYEVSIYDPIRDKGIKDEVKYGTKASELPKVNAADTTIGDCSYKFIGWTPEFADVTRDMDYDAVYEKTCKVQYTVTWTNADGKQLEKKKYNAGEKPVYGGTTPVKESSAQFDYRFSGWTPTVVAVTKDATYKAKYDSTYRKYAVTFKDSLKHKGFVDGEMTAMYRYGTKASAVQVPTIADTTIGKCTYVFSKWDKAIADVTAAATYEAIYTSNCDVPPVSSSSVTSSSSVAKSSSSVAKSSSSVAKSSSSVAKSSDSAAKSSSSVKATSSSVAQSSSSVVKSSSSVAKSSDSAAKSSSSVKVTSSSVAQSSSSVVKSSGSVAKSSDSAAKSSSSVAKSSDSAAKSSSSVKATSSAAAKSSSSVKATSSAAAKSSSSVKATSSTAAKSSSSVKAISSAAAKSSSSVKATSSAAAKSSSSVKATSSAAAKSSSSVKATSSAAAKSSSSVKATSSAAAKSSSGAKPKSSSATAKSSSGKKTSSSSKGSNFVMDDLRGFMKFGYENNTLTVSLMNPSMVQVHVFDMKGQLQEEFNEYVAGSREFNFDRLRRGNYVVRVTSNSMQKISRIMIK